MPFDGRIVENIDVEAVALLRHGAEALRSVGWCQEIYEDEDGSVCMLGALGWREYEEDFGHPHIGDPVVDRATAMLCAAVGLDEEEGIWTWNDSGDRTEGEVLAAYDRAIAQNA